METTQLTVLLACVSLTLIVNCAMYWMVYRALNNLAMKAEEKVKEFDRNTPFRQWLDSLQTTSAEAARVSGIVKDRLAACDPQLQQFQAAYAQTLSKTDARCKLAFRAAHVTAGAMMGAVTWPIEKFQAMASALQGVMTFIRGSENGADARPRPNE